MSAVNGLEANETSDDKERTPRTEDVRRNGSSIIIITLYNLGFSLNIEALNLLAYCFTMLSELSNITVLHMKKEPIYTSFRVLYERWIRTVT
jgi:hypothetical protein